MPSPALAALVLLIPFAAQAAEELRGYPRVIDGDTVKIADLSLRLIDIDAPESDQPHGPASTAHLLAMIGGEEVVCRWEEYDRYGRPLATCYPVLDSGRTSTVSLNARMVREGWATAALPYGYRLERAQSWAMAACRGMWQAMGLPWCWRKAKRDGD